MSASGACRVPGRLQRAAGGDATGAQPKRKKESKAMEAPVRQPGGLLYFLIKRQVGGALVVDC